MYFAHKRASTRYEEAMSQRQRCDMYIAGPERKIPRDVVVPEFETLRCRCVVFPLARDPCFVYPRVCQGLPRRLIGCGSRRNVLEKCDRERTAIPNAV